MELVDFTPRGVLPSGLYNCSKREFIERFCYVNANSSEYEIRQSYKNVIDELFSLATAKGANSIIFGGSFITNEKEPDDLDCIIIVKNEKCLPIRNDYFFIDRCKLDIMYAIQDDIEHIYAMMNLFAKDKLDYDVGLVEVALDGEYSTTWSDYKNHENFDKLLEYRKKYGFRKTILGNSMKGVIVSLHGFNTDAKWNSDFAPIASSDYWIFAPFHYGNVKIPIIDRASTQKIVDNFREWIYQINKEYISPPNIIAHSFGTYILGKYIKDFSYKPPVKFGGVILTGSILNENYDWIKCMENYAIRNVYNLISPNDQWVTKIDIPKFIKKEDLYGKAGVKGFVQEHPSIFQEKIDIFDHGSMLKSDIFRTKIIPHFNYVHRMKNFESKIEYIKIKNQERGCP